MPVYPTIGECIGHVCVLHYRGIDKKVLPCLFTSQYKGHLSVVCFTVWTILSSLDRVVGLVVRRPPRERKIPGSNPDCGGIFLGSSHTSDLKIGTPVATLPDAWRYRVSTRTGRPGVSIL